MLLHVGYVRFHGENDETSGRADAITVLVVRRFASNVVRSETCSWLPCLYATVLHRRRASRIGRRRTLQSNGPRSQQCRRSSAEDLRQRVKSSSIECQPTPGGHTSTISNLFCLHICSDFGCISPEASWVCVSTFVGLVFGGLHGGIRHAFIQRYQHLERNEATLYDSQRVALRTLMDKIHLGFIRGFFAHGFRVGFMIFTIVYVPSWRCPCFRAAFAFSFIRVWMEFYRKVSPFFGISGTSTVLSSYRNKASVLDYTAGGVLAGSIYKFSLGPKGMVAGGFFGGFLATICGVMWVAMLKLSGIPLSEYYGQTHRYFRARDEQFHQAFKVSCIVTGPKCSATHPKTLYNSSDNNHNSLGFYAYFRHTRWNQTTYFTSEKHRPSVRRRIGWTNWKT